MNATSNEFITCIFQVRNESKYCQYFEYHLRHSYEKVMKLLKRHHADFCNRLCSHIRFNFDDFMQRKLIRLKLFKALKTFT